MAAFCEKKKKNSVGPVFSVDYKNKNGQMLTAKLKSTHRKYTTYKTR